MNEETERRIEERLRYYTQGRERFWGSDVPPIDFPQGRGWSGGEIEINYMYLIDPDTGTSIDLLAQLQERQETNRVARRLLEQVFGSEGVRHAKRG